MATGPTSVPIGSNDIGRPEWMDVLFARIRNQVLPPRAPGQPLQAAHTASDDEILAAYHVFASLPYPETAWRLGGVLDVVTPTDAALVRQVREQFARSIRRPLCN